MLLFYLRNGTVSKLFIRSSSTLKGTSLGRSSSVGNRRHDDTAYRKSILQLAEEQKFEEEKKRKRRIEWSWQAAALLILPATTFWLGCWQVRRLKWKEGVLKDIYTRMQQPITELNSSNLDAYSELAYRSVKVTGTFIYGKELVVNMKRKKDGEGGLGDLMNAAGDGYFVITPFRLADSRKVIMVNRGWVDSERTSPDSLKNTQVDGVQTFEAIVPPTEKKRWLLKELNEKSDVEDKKKAWSLKNIREMAEILKSEPVLVDAVKGLSVPGGPMEGQTSYMPPNNHLSYVVTWYALTGFMLVMWCSRYLM